MAKLIKEIENPIERADARFERFSEVESIRERQQKRERALKLTIGIAAAVCALYAVYMQF